MRRREPAPGSLYRVPESGWTEHERWAVDWLEQNPEETSVETEEFVARSGLSAGQRLFAVDRKPQAVPERNWTEEEKAIVDRLRTTALDVASGKIRPGERADVDHRSPLLRVTLLDPSSGGEPKFAVFRKPTTEREV